MELIEAGKAAYKASQSRNQEAVSDVSNQLADACLHCHEVYRDKPGGTTADPSNKAARCLPDFDSAYCRRVFNASAQRSSSSSIDGRCLLVGLVGS